MTDSRTLSDIRVRRVANAGRQLGLLTKLLITALITIMILGPVYWMVLTALRPDAQLFAVPPKVLPTALQFSVVARAVADTPIAGWLGNSALIAGITTIACIALGAPAGYVLSRNSTKGTRFAGGAILVTQMMPPMLLLVPLFVIFQYASLTDSRAGLILADTATTLPLAIWMSKAMIDGIPRELDDAALVDGCGRFRLLLFVIIPISLPGLLATATYAFIETWDEFLFAKTLLTSTSKWPASVGLYSFEGQYVTPINQVMFAAILFSLPPLILFFLIRRGLVKGMTAGAVKG